jgi:acylphosphatase
MKKSVRIFVAGSVQPLFFNQFIKDNADKLGVRGFVRKLEDGRIEIFVEGDMDSVNKMIPICKRGPPHSMIKSAEEKEERFQDFKDFKIFKI